MKEYFNRQKAMNIQVIVCNVWNFLQNIRSSLLNIQRNYRLNKQCCKDESKYIDIQRAGCRTWDHLQT